MRLDRNTTERGDGKYAILKLRELERFRGPGPFDGSEEIDAALRLLADEGILDWGPVGTESEFFVIRLRDRYAKAALEAYAVMAGIGDPEYAQQVQELADRAGPNSPFCKTPD